MSPSRPPSDDWQRSEVRTRHRSFAWGESPNSPGGIAGRQAELARLDALLAATGAGESTALLVTGEPGIGKTTLLQAAERLATGFCCLWARGVESESVLAHAGLLQALDPIRDAMPEVPAGQASALSAALGWDSALTAPVDRFLVGAAVLSLLAAAAESAPVLVLVDDLQWLDRESVAALAFAARRLRQDQVCFILAGRADLISLEHMQGTPVLSLDGLSATDARLLLPERVAERVVVHLVHETGGNPLAMLEISRRLTDAQRVGAAPLPDAPNPGDRLIRMYTERLAALSEPTRRAVLLTALNRSGRWAVVAETLGREGIEPGAVVDEAQDLGILVGDTGQITFRHPLLRTAVLSSASAADQRSAHQALADALAADRDSVAATWHRAEATALPDQALALDLVEAAQQLRSRQGYAAASIALERAALLAEDPAAGSGWLATAAEDALLAGDGSRTRSLVARVLTGSGPDQVVGRALFTLGMLEEYAGSVPQSAELLASAAHRLAGEHRTYALAELALARFRLNDVSGVAECIPAIIAAADRDDPMQQMLSDFTQGFAATVAGDPVTGGPLLRAVIDQIADVSLRDDPRALLYLALAAGFVGDPGKVMPLGLHQLALVRSRGALGVLVPALSLSAAARAWLGDHAGAFADAGEAVELGDQLGYLADVAVALEMLAWQSAARGRHDDAQAALDRATALTDRAGTTSHAAHQAITAGFCAMSRGDPALAVSVLEARLAIDGGTGSMGEPLGVAPDLVEAYLALGRRDDALALAERFGAATPATAPPWLRALAARSSGLAAADSEAAARWFEAALAAHTDAPDRFEAARTHLLYGVQLRRTGRRVDARPQLRTALDEFAAMDLTAWARRAGDELSATGANPRSRRPQRLSDQPLTSQETRVALHAASGMATRDIAAALFLSPRTVEHHLSSVYRKKGVRTRAELAASFRPPGQPDG